MTRTDPLDAFKAWLSENGASFPSLSFKASRSGCESRGRGLFTTNRITLEEGKSIATVPAKLVINTSLVVRIAKYGRTTPAKKLAQCVDGLRKGGLSAEGAAWERVCLLVFLLWGWVYSEPLREETGRERDSGEIVEEDPALSIDFWLPYVRILPDIDGLDTPVFWSGSPALSLLKGMELDDAVRAKKLKLTREYSELLPHLSILDNAKGRITLERFMWADGVFWSRVLSFGSALEGTDTTTSDDYHLVPLVDFCNHSFDQHIGWHISESASCRVELRAVDMAVGDVAADTELFISYGQKPNSELLFIHGFVVPENPFETLIVPAPFIEGSNVPFEPDGDEESEERELSEEAEIEREERKMQKIGAQIAIKDKLQFLSLLGLRRVIDISRPPMSGNVDEDEQGEIEVDMNDPTKGLLTDDGLLAMYVSVLTAEDGFGRTDAGGPRDNPEYNLGGHKIFPLTKETFSTLVQALPHYEVIRLRVFAVLLDMINFRLYELSGEYTQGRATRTAPLKEGDVITTEDMRMNKVEVFREGQYDLLVAAFGLLQTLQERWAEFDVVQEYLTAIQAGSDDE
ncbi:uncharacterized protein SPPG_07599 [Spizellomyces punctatus DAOM BR117]|uniref:SET domain-containing protein n=1 Tax=Spizellomyces punctatus (strain DAOM BR117) TaxID=645134 RepID=A0A0L0H7L6_SPIPD|nr:uncharacterized protein SPPG_07599 [Spizellomyces punctatus DAOM BR117]KNC97212.1 hypothetical protein SPPG_07599 [Spizellomyces punctatus DAOM BR117]|eukprot:XP_016605252.1 hypothetical protein SPPG_07599 [Spizellomyces punctatus DAOM BR117]